jgi:RNA polymerase sigma-32 factor
LFFSLAKERDKILAEGFRPEPRLLAERLDVKEEEVVQMAQRLGVRELSLDSPIGDETRNPYGAVLPDPTSSVDKLISEKQKRQLLKKKFNEFRTTLSGKEADIFDNRIMAEEPLTLQQLGKKYHISRERVRQIQNKIIGKAKTRLEQQIPDFKELYFEGISAVSH